MQLQEQLQEKEKHLQQAEQLVQEEQGQQQEEPQQKNVLDPEHLQQEEVQVQEVRHRAGGISGLGREVHRRHAKLADRVVVRPRQAADIEGRLVTEHELIR